MTELPSYWLHFFVVDSACYLVAWFFASSLFPFTIFRLADSKALYTSRQDNGVAPPFLNYVIRDSTDSCDIRPPDIHVSGLMFYHIFFLLSSFFIFVS